MSLGNNNYQNNDKKKAQSAKVFSQYKMSNTESEVDATQLSTTFWNNFIVLSIAPKKQSKYDRVEWDHENNISIYLSHTKARMLAKEIEEFLKDPNAHTNLGVNAGNGLICISNGKEYGVNCPLIIIHKLNENGEIESSFAYQIKQNYHYTIRNFNKENPSEFDKLWDDLIELEQLHTLLTEYYKAMTGAYAYPVMENIKYDMSRINTKLDSCAEKLGVVYNTGSNNSGATKSSPFDNAEGRKFSSASVDDINKM